MKKFLNKFLLVAMAFILAFSVVGCKKKKGESTEESKKPAVEESLPEITNPVIPADGVDVSSALDLLAPVLGNAYTTIRLDADINATVNSETVTMAVDGVAYIKMTGKGYDAVAEFSAQVSEPGYSDEMSAKLWFVDGTAAFGVSYSGEPMQYSKITVGNVNDLLTQVNMMIAQQPELKAQYEQIMPVVEQVIATIQEEGNKLEAVDETIDYKAIYDQVVGHIVANKNMNMYDWALTYVLGVDATDSQAVIAFENSVLAIGQENPSLATVLDRLVALVNSKLPADSQISLKAIVDEIQSLTGLTTAEIVQMFNEYMYGEEVYNPATQDYVIVVNPDLALPAPEAGVTLYDYVYALLNTQSLSTALEEMGYDSFQELCEDAKLEMQSATLGDIVNEGIHAYLSYMGYSSDGQWQYVYTPGEGYYDYDSYYDTYTYVGYGGDYSEVYVPVDYISLIESMNISIGSMSLNLKFTPDAKGRPTLLSYTVAGNMALAYGGTNYTVSENGTVKLTFSYTKPSISFAIPSDVLAQAVDMANPAY